MSPKNGQHTLGLGRFLLVACSTWLVTGCGSASASLSIAETLTVIMSGVFETPADALGNAEPKSLTFTLEDLTATTADGTELDLYTDDPTDFVIISRAQIIAEAELSDYVGDSIASLTVTFSPGIEGKGKYEDAMTTTLTNAAATYENAFTVATGKALQLDISVQWKSIVTRDDDAETESMSSPTFIAELGNGN